MLGLRGFIALALFLVGNMEATVAVAAELGMGLRVGEVTQNSAVVWTRITKTKERNWDGIVAPPLRSKNRKVEISKIPVPDLEGEITGAPGLLRLSWSTNDTFEDANVTKWVAAEASGDFVHQFEINELTPGTKYFLRIDAKDAEDAAVSATATGSFSTPVEADQWQDASFAVVTGQMYKDLDHREGFHIYPAMKKVGVDFIVPTGDTVYYDNETPRANTLELARYHWHRMYSLPRHIEFHQTIPGYWEVDDHDALSDDCWPTKNPKFMLPLTFEQGYATFREQVPLGTQPTHRTVRYGKGLQIWMVEGRLYRSPNNSPDGPEKTIWGKEQREWLMKSILESDADFKVLVSPTPIVGPDRSGKKDNHANKVFAYEGNLFRDWTAEQKLDNFFVCCGDRHWQYYSIDPKTKLKEFSCGPASDQHAGGTPGQDFEVQPFHRVKGGFLTVNVLREKGSPVIAFRHHDVHGKVVNEYKQVGQEK
ncbi:alkaline phosphatase D family protein [Thalassoglobus polymorphus]|uniref:PhoD-like phosphatase n=1 Tax=Thalassoglobus polymorphus TaxID=2527994 RepID=A0A517QHS5_9PLAN|nr:alkaline phosphatase D family protein [Thalassoglobus polymorphus]QDT31180.1 PhoD-like phosphatase [Thalassoglobus polymorphus]